MTAIATDEEIDRGPYTEQEDVDLVKINSLRNKLITKLVGNQADPTVPGKTSEMVLLHGMIDGMEKQIHTRVKQRMAAKAAASEDSLRGEIRHLLLNYSEPPRREVTDEELTIPAHLKRPEFKPGALDVGTVAISMRDIKIEV